MTSDHCTLQDLLGSGDDVILYLGSVCLAKEKAKKVWDQKADLLSWKLSQGEGSAHSFWEF